MRLHPAMRCPWLCGRMWRLAPRARWLSNGSGHFSPGSMAEFVPRPVHRCPRRCFLRCAFESHRRTRVPRGARRRHIGRTTLLQLGRSSSRYRLCPGGVAMRSTPRIAMQARASRQRSGSRTCRLNQDSQPRGLSRPSNPALVVGEIVPR